MKKLLFICLVLIGCHKTVAPTHKTVAPTVQSQHTITYKFISNTTPVIRWMSSAVSNSHTIHDTVYVSSSVYTYQDIQGVPNPYLRLIQGQNNSSTDSITVQIWIA